MNSLRYICLEFRPCIEAITYEQAESYLKLTDNRALEKCGSPTNY